MEKYEEERQSRVHLWVDEAAKRPKDKELSADAYPPLKKPQLSSIVVSPLATADKPPHTEENNSVDKDNTGKSDVIETTEIFSDFSDDDEVDVILTKEIPEPEEAETVIKTEEDENKSKVTTIEDKVSATVPVGVGVEGQSMRSQMSHTEDDDILETMDFEEISDEELDEKGNKVHIVDALGVDWSSLVCKEKTRPESPSSVSLGSVSSSYKVRERWNAIQVLKQVGVHRDLCGEERFQRVLQKVKESCKGEETVDEEELENPMKRRRRLERENLIENLGLGPDSRALCSRRELAMR